MQDYYKTKRLTHDDVNKILDGYYDERGWDIELGVPSSAKLRELGLEFAVKAMVR